MAGRIRSYMRGKRADHIDFDSSCPFSVAGGNGDVFRGTHILEVYPDGSPKRFCYVALKSMRCGTDDDDNTLAKIIDEASIWKDLYHPHVLHFLGLLTDVRGTYLVCPFAPHGSLPQYLVRNPDADRPTFIGQVAAGLAYLHEMGIVHGDVKGANILVFDGPSARVCDFGLAKIADPNPGTTQNQVGSCYWMSPERMFGQTRTKASDVYAFGLTIYEILSGSIPFAGLDSVALVQAVHFREERPPTQPQVSSTGVSYASLWTLAALCWSQLPQGRPQMAEALDAIVANIGNLAETSNDDLPILSAPSPPAVVTAGKRKRRKSLPESSDTDESDAGPGEASTPAVDMTGPKRPAKRAKVNVSVAGASNNNQGTGVPGQSLQGTPEAVNVGTEVVYPSAVLPSRPDALFGREGYLEDIIGRLCHTRAPRDENQPASTPPRLAILGPGGIGKTTVALAAVLDRRVKSIYDDCIHWVPCEEATSPELFVELIARSMDVPKGKGADRKRDIIDHLRSTTTHPRLLLLDNFETPWDIPTKQSDIDSILFDVASVGSLTILLTMRSDLPPSTRIRWTKPVLPPLATLSLSAARELYMDIQDNAGNDPNLDLLLHELAFMPLAVRLMANRGRLGETPTELWESWKDERQRTKLLHLGDDRITSVMVSVELSINSNLIRRNPEALSLLSVLAELPAGARREFVQNLAPSLTDINGALGTLRQAALVQSHPSTHQIQLLSPIRSLVLDKHRATPELRTSLLQAYFSLVRKYNSAPGHPIFLEAVKILGAEEVNIETLLLDAVANDPSDACISAAYDYAEFQRSTVPRAEIIERTVSVVQNSNRDAKLLVAGLRVQAKMYYMLDRYNDAVEVESQVVALYKELGDLLGEARSLRRLGDVYRMLRRYDDAVQVGKQVMVMFKNLCDQRGEANSLYSLADVYRMLGRYDEAVEAVKQAMVIFKKIGDQLGEANSLNSLAEAYWMLGRYDEALEAGKQAMVIFKRIGHQRGEANSLNSLAEAYRMLGRYDEALEAGKQAMLIFKNIGYQRGESNSLNILAATYRTLKRYDEALEAGKQAMLISKKIGDQLGEASTLRVLGWTYKSLGRQEEAVRLARESLVIFQGMGLEHEVNICGDLLRSLGVDS